MKKAITLVVAAALCLPLAFSCQEASVVPGEPDPEENQPSYPKPKEQIAAVPLTRAEQGFVVAGNKFAWDLTGKIWDQNPSGKSLFISPLSVQYALGMLLNGADEPVAKQITTILGYEGTEAINAFCSKLISDLPRVDTTVTLALANGVVVDERYTLKAPFKTTVEEAYDALVKSMPFSDPGAVVKYINDWCNDHTFGRIPEVLKSVSPGAFMYLMNAIYYHAGWAKPFDKAETRSEDFKTASGTVRVPMMHRKFDSLYGETESCEAVFIPYGNGRYMMTVYLPKEKQSISSLLAASGQNLPPLTELCHVVLSLPSFQTDYEIEMKDLLCTQMGLPSGPYTELVEKASNPPTIGRIIHKANFTVNETGAEGAAVTVVEMEVTAADPSEPQPKPQEPRTIIFTADHPFLYTIWETTSGVILFTGVYSGD